MTMWTPIDFKDIRKGDKIKSIRHFDRPTGTRVHDEVEGVAAVHHRASGDEPAEWRDSDDAMHVAIDAGTWWCYLDPDSRPPEPEIPVGTAGTARTSAGGTYRAMRTENGYEIVNPAGKRSWVPLSEVTDFVPDTLLTDEAAEKIRAEERERLAKAFLDGRDGVLFQEARNAVVRWLRGGAK